MRALLLAALALMPLPALAHDGVHADGFAAGFLHPLTGADHVAAMVAIGLWAAMLGGRMRAGLPMGFLGGMLAGGVLALLGLALPMVEHGMLASVIVLGVLVAGAVRLPPALATGIAAAFGMLHGHAHGAELQQAFVAALPGFLLATALLHGAGLLLAGGASSQTSRLAVRCAGGATAAVAALALLLPG